jgi:hypothetical protein
MRRRIQHHGFTVERLAFAQLGYLRAAKGFAPPLYCTCRLYRYNKLMVYREEMLARERGHITEYTR